jgi:hypothetical protein
MTPREKALEEALRLCDAWLVLPLDRGGKCGPKGRAFDAFLTAKDAALSLPASAGEERPATAELRERVARAICKTDRFDTGEGTCAALCMEQLGDPRRKGCGHALRVHGTLVDAILAALPELAGGSEWRPIETAPKDGSDVLLYCRCQHDGRAYAPDRNVGWWEPAAGWWHARDGLIEPTHWMPLPAPPASGSYGHG